MYNGVIRNKGELIMITYNTLNAYSLDPNNLPKIEVLVNAAVAGHILMDRIGGIAGRVFYRYVQEGAGSLRCPGSHSDLNVLKGHLGKSCA